MYGGVVYGRILDKLIPGWYDEVPVQRWITRRQTIDQGYDLIARIGAADDLFRRRGL